MRSIHSKFKFALRSMWEMLYPRLCLHCQMNTAVKDHLFCIHCLRDYVETDYHLIPDNPVARHFYGRVKVERAASLLDFKKGSLSQTLLHELKYNRRKEIGVSLGERYAKKLKTSGFLNGIDAIIPVPLHRKKLKKRGFNQSALFAVGMREICGLPVYEKTLLREVNTETQTRKHRMERIDNVAKAFRLSKPEKVRNNHILLVDDVVTTGATMEACANVLLSEKKVKVSLAAIALG